MSNADHRPIIYDETASSKLSRKAKDAPFLVAGVAGMLAVVAIGAYKFKHRGEMSTSVFLMQLRVTAQSAVIGSLTIGLAIQMAQQHIFGSKSE